jgi:hypothetical protein
MQAAETVPLDLRDAFLARVAAELRGKDSGTDSCTGAYEAAKSVGTPLSSRHQ